MRTSTSSPNPDPNAFRVQSGVNNPEADAASGTKSTASPTKTGWLSSLSSAGNRLKDAFKSLGTTKQEEGSRHVRKGITTPRGSLSKAAHAEAAATEAVANKTVAPSTTITDKVTQQSKLKEEFINKLNDAEKSAPPGSDLADVKAALDKKFKLIREMKKAFPNWQQDCEKEINQLVISIKSSQEQLHGKKVALSEPLEVQDDSNTSSLSRMSTTSLSPQEDESSIVPESEVPESETETPQSESELDEELSSENTPFPPTPQFDKLTYEELEENLNGMKQLLEELNQELADMKLLETDTPLFQRGLRNIEQMASDYRIVIQNHETELSKRKSEYERRWEKWDAQSMYEP